MKPVRQTLAASATAVVELVVNLDDSSPQVVGDAQRRLLDAGALDVWTTPIGMKKQRPGVMLSVLCEPAKRDATARLILELTGSFGVRFRAWDRLVLDRSHETVATRFGSIRVKVGRLDGEVIVARPEYEDVRDLAEHAGVTLREAMDAATAAADAWRTGGASGANGHARRPRPATKGGRR